MADRDEAARQAARRQEFSDAARRRHDALTAAIERIDGALTAAVVGRAQVWSERVATDLVSVREAIRAHVDDAEQAGGLFDEIQVSAPRLRAFVAALRREHEALLAQVGALGDQLPVGEGADFARLRREAAALLTALRGHRAAQADLVYEAFWIDLGAGD